MACPKTCLVKSYDLLNTNRYCKTLKGHNSEVIQGVLNFCELMSYTTYVPSLLEFWGGHFSSVVDGMTHVCRDDAGSI